MTQEKKYICLMGSVPALNDVTCDFYKAGECKNKKYCNQKAELK